MAHFLEREAIARYWSDFVDDCEAIAADDREAGWETHLLSPGDVTPIADPPEHAGLDVLVPGETFDTLREWVEDDGRTFERTTVYRQARENVVFLLLSLYDEPTETAIYVPMTYHVGGAEAMIEAVRSSETITITLRPLSGDDAVQFGHDEPDLFLPPESTEDDA
ncbi:DUF7529 family protein [Halovivax limisalsi]|uniref:DUF7529 family protein n=1 Tax=Halovivax limisalsi TaxID=1453760 RepID=UPI001FFD41CE|nr:hypothetical protein [Halovivax limisalsi]